MGVYEKNLKALKETNKDLFNRLSKVKTNEIFEVFVGKDPIDINILENATKETIYKDPILDTQEALKKFDEFSNYPYFFFYGIGNGVLLKALLENQNLKHLVVIDPQIELIYIALNMLDFSAEIMSLRFILSHAEDLNDNLAFSLAKLEKIHIYTKLYDLHQISPYYAKFSSDLQRVNKLIIKALLQAVKNHGNDTKDSLIGLEHFILNLDDMLSFASLKNLSKAKNSSLAVCVATGPSLTKQLPLLKKYQDKITIISVDASLPILYKWNIKPDIVTSLERVELTASFFANVDKNWQKDIVFVHSALQHRAVINASFGQKTIVMRPFGYMQCFGLDDFGYAGIGMSAANLSLEIAYFMGYETICFIGQDLAYAPSGNTHADDHTFGAKDTKFEENIKHEERLEVLGYDKTQMVQTNAIWLMFLNFFVMNIAEISPDVECINATEGGAFIEGATHKSFEETLKKYAQKEPKNAIILNLQDTKTKQENLQKAKIVIKDMLKYGEEIQEKIKTFYEKLKTQKEVLSALNLAGELDKINTQEIKTLLDELDEIKKIFSEERFHSYFWEGLRAVIISNELDLAKIVVKKASSKNDLLAKNIDFLLSHLNWSLLAMGVINKQCLIVKKASSYLEI